MGVLAHQFILKGQRLDMSFINNLSPLENDMTIAKRHRF
jgi:hypothetical protein